jgi:hypothetical protein
MSEGGKIDFDLRKAANKPANREAWGDDIWEEDIPYYRSGENGGYDWYFNALLKNEGAPTFQSMMEERKKEGKPANVLDLFGGGYYIDDLSAVDSITGVRLANNSQEALRYVETIKNAPEHQNKSENWHKKMEYAEQHMQELMASSKWGIVEGNLYRPTTWTNLRGYQHEKGIPSFDLITVKPDGAFKNDELVAIEHYFPDNREHYARVFLRLLGRAYTSLSFNEGKLFTETPAFFLESYMIPLKSIGENEGGLKIDIVDGDHYAGRKHIAITKYPDSTTDLEGLVLSSYKKD